MMKIVSVSSVGDRVGQHEYEEIEQAYQVKKNSKLLKKTKDVRIGLLLLMAKLETAAIMTTDEKTDEPNDNTMKWVCHHWSLEHFALASGFFD